VVAYNRGVEKTPRLESSITTKLTAADVRERVRRALVALGADPSAFDVIPNENIVSFEEALSCVIRRKDRTDLSVVITRAPFDDKNDAKIQRLLSPLVASWSAQTE
jgi:hypothetical protein